MNRKALDPNLVSILDSIRATVGAEESMEAADDLGRDSVPVAVPTKAPAVASVKPASAASAGRTVEDFLADLIRPQVEAWLNANLPEIVQKMAAEEVQRLTNPK